MVYMEWSACTGCSSDPRRKRRGDGEAVARDGAGDPWNRMGVVYLNHGIYVAPSLRYLSWSSARVSGGWVEAVAEKRGRNLAACGDRTMAIE
jgi:hypothetical protein